MSVLDARASSVILSMLPGEATAPKLKFATSAEASYRWFPSPLSAAHSLRIDGTGFAYGGSIALAGSIGSITAVTGKHTDFTVTSIVSGPTDLASFVSLSNFDWGVVLRGGDSLLAPQALPSALAGDGSVTVATQLLGTVLAGDNITLDGQARGQFCGDAFMTFGHVIGGDDIITSSSAYVASSNEAPTSLIGDIMEAFGDADGGEDVIRANGSASANSICGDVLTGHAGASIRGGADILRGGKAGDTIMGDAGSVQGAFTGAADDIAGNGGNDVIIGDGSVFIGNSDPAAPQLQVFCGDDLLRGNAGNDIITGDAETSDGRAVMHYGADTLFGNAGNDLLFGDFRSFAGLTVSSEETRLGADIIDGGDGNDTIRGQFGGDRLFGGAGDDIIVGGVGDDSVTGGSGNDRIGLGDGKDILIAEANGGADIVIDFTDGADRIDMRGTPFASFAQVLALATSSNGGTLITFSSGNTLTLDNFQLALLDASDFVF